jgi:selenocysteine lyase/cysteine desulfurase
MIAPVSSTSTERTLIAEDAVPITRRELLAGLGGLAATAVTTRLGVETIGTPSPIRAALPDAMRNGEFPRKQDFAIAEGYTYINGAYTHPMPIAAGEAYRAVVDRRSRLGFPTGGAPRLDARASFAALINAKPSEIAWIQNTSSGENLVIEALGLNRPFDGNIVTDELHFEGALIHLLELQKAGADVRIAKHKDGRVDIKDLERLVDRRTKLVEVSFVAMYNGFQHNLKAVSDLAHAHGAYVYADIIQGCGAVPLDVRATGIDFAATATYKWLMGDFGLAFFFVREDLLGRVFRRPHWSYDSASNAEIHISPFDPESPKAVTYTPGNDAAGYVQLGTTASAIAAALAVSVPYISALGVANIQNHRIPMLRKLQAEMPRLGFVAQTPLDSTSPIVTFALKDGAAINRKLEAAKVNVRVAPHWMRIAPSVYNDMADVDRLLEALS